MNLTSTMDPSAKRSRCSAAIFFCKPSVTMALTSRPTSSSARIVSWKMLEKSRAVIFLLVYQNERGCFHTPNTLLIMATSTSSARTALLPNDPKSARPTISSSSSRFQVHLFSEAFQSLSSWFGEGKATEAPWSTLPHGLEVGENILLPPSSLWLSPEVLHLSNKKLEKSRINFILEKSKCLLFLMSRLGVDVTKQEVLDSVG
ncbi:Glutamine-dependent NAD(+) synthetase [Frankliniella fusca]|uniref:Glutamine-dependent NAD(+) synthetase n=1 Tax=Frankliniella fusca TaxID=407009 RepID=A0AAE1HSM3_9NEOP|nr:Glutamine-dependent NAD(+) synthetase [Frankliniella fusca]KAK3914841.1 Glutamine-dependent NAD(+) synthetase [Frankliniella fusca]KAK3926684.1 Glutamine-dependent NAD(+) synthetase [Frankliniella fusca]